MNHQIPLPTTGLTLLHLAAYYDFFEAFLFFSGHDKLPICIKSASSFLPLHYAYARGSLEIICYILTQNPELVSKTTYDNFDDHSYLFYALESTNIRVLETLFNNGYNLNDSFNVKDVRIILEKMVSKRPYFIPYLLPKIIEVTNPRTKSDSSLSLIMLAIISNNFEAVKPLLEYGYDESLKSTSWNGETAFDYACQKKQKGLVKLIISHMYHFGDNPRYAKSICYSLCELCSPSLVKYVLFDYYPPDFDFQSSRPFIDILKCNLDKREPPLFALLKNQNTRKDNIHKVIKIVQLFLQKGYPIDYQPEGKNTFLAETCLGLYPINEKPLDLIQFLLEKGANPNSIIALKKVPLYQYLKKMSMTRGRKDELEPIIMIFEKFVI